MPRPIGRGGQASGPRWGWPRWASVTPTRTPDVLDADAPASLKGLGLAGPELDHQDHGPDERARLRGIAADHDLGVNTTDPGQYERLLPLATSDVRLG